MVDRAVARIRAFANWRGWKPARLAKEAGLSLGTLRGMDAPDWNPTRETLRQIEALIPPEFDAAAAPAGRAA
jgi:lambda repressor-like predicted transcriptional regulator